VIKRYLATAILVWGLTAPAQAEVRVKDLGNGQAELTFRSSDPSPDLAVIGSFDNWTVPGEAMTKSADGVWEKVLTVAVTDEVTYKFYSQGTWIFDPQAPDKKDDGFGGFNGLVVVADVLAGLTAAPAAAGDAGPALAKAVGSKLNFGTYTIVGSRSVFSTQGVVDRGQKGLELDSTGIFAKSYWKLGGSLVPGINAWFELKAVDATQPVWAQDARGVVSPGLNEGLTKLFAGLVTNPLNFLAGGNNPSLNSLKGGFETGWLAAETGYGSAKPQKRTALLWQTLEERDAGDGYFRFDLGNDLKKVGDLGIDATFAPNKMTGNFGLFSWLGLSLRDSRLDLQYDAKSAQSTKLGQVFDKLYHQDYLVGFRTKAAGIEVTAQGLMNRYSETAFDPGAHLAGEAKATWSVNDDALGTTLGYRYTGSGSELLFGNNADYLGQKGTQRSLANLWGKPVTGLKLGVDTTLTLDNQTPTGAAKSYFVAYGKPWFEASFDRLVGQKAGLNGYAKLNYALREGYRFTQTNDRFLWSEAGLKASLPGLDLTYGFNGGEDARTLQTLLASWTFPKDLAAQAGIGYRAARDTATAAQKTANNPLAFTLGTSWKLPEPALKTPLLYANFVYNMDPYDDNSNNLDFSDFITDGGVAKGDGKAQLRLLIKWDF